MGYRPREVDEAIAVRDAQLEAGAQSLAAAEARTAAASAEPQTRRAAAARAAERIEELEHVAARLATMVVDRNRDLNDLREAVRLALDRDDHAMGTLAALADDLEMVRRQARAQATRIRLRALRDAADVAERITELENGGDARERLVSRLEEAIERVGTEEDLTTDMASNGHVERARGEMFEGLIEVEVGPLSDFSQLVGLEDAASGIGAASEISVKRFTQGRATLAMRFKHPVELLRELEERAPFEFKVRDTRANRIVLDLDD